MTRPGRRGLVLGGGGVLGAAWMVGAMSVLEDEIGVDLREFDELVGTSAGSVLCALLGAGVSVSDLRRHQLGEPMTSGPLAGFHWDYENATGGDTPQRPRVRIGSGGLLVRNARHLRRLPPTAVLSALLPEGRGRLDSVGALVRHVVPEGWVDRDGVRVVAMDYESGQRIPFGGPDAPAADLADAVMASCAIPGWYQPVRIDGRRYIDGGAWSATSVDLMVGRELDEVYVVAPMVSFAMDEPTQLSHQAGAAVAGPGDPALPARGRAAAPWWHRRDGDRPGAARPRGHRRQPDGCRATRVGAADGAGDDARRAARRRRARRRAGAPGGHPGRPGRPGRPRRDDDGVRRVD